jgi:peptide chain release factor 1
MLEKLKKMSLRHEELERKIQDPGFMANKTEYARALREMGILSRQVERYREYERVLARIAEAEEIVSNEDDGDLVALAREELDELRASERELFEEMKRIVVEDDTHVGKDLIVEVRAGTGGDEATLFSADLFRMYQKFAEAHGLKIEILSTSTSEVGGFKEIIFSVAGAEAWNLLRFESGGHRVQRVPVTESQGRIHTSAATVAVLPEAAEVEIDLKETDLKIDTFCASGPGGQNVNKVATAIRILHVPTGLTVQCQDESSQHKNRAKALRILKARLYDIEMSRREKERAEERRSQIGTGDRNMRVRTYNFPQNRVTDHRIKTSYSLETVIEGGLDKVVEDLRRWDVEEKIKEL